MIVFNYHRFFLAKIMYLSSAGTEKSAHSQQLRALPDGVLGVKRTLQYMRRFTNEAKILPGIRNLAHSIVARVPSKDWAAEVEAIQNWVRSNIRYTFDVAGVETLQRPDVTVDLGHGDCDDHAALVAALGESVGYPARFVAIGSGSDYEHVFAELFLPELGWLSVETTEPVPVGWEPSYKIRMVLE